MRCFFATDLHGDERRYRGLFDAAAAGNPDAVFLGGDLLPALAGATARAFLDEVVGSGLRELRAVLKSRFPRVFFILGNDDPRLAEPALHAMEREGLAEYIHERRVPLGSFDVYGYAFVPPTPFALKDWERYDVSRYVDPGCVSPEDGLCSLPLAVEERRYATIQADLARLVGERPLDRAIFLFHGPAYGTSLDRAALDDRRVDGVPMDVHVGSIAIRRFIEERQPLLTLHGHVHESAALSGTWRERIGRTILFSAAHSGPELALVRFDPERLDEATRDLV
ncbi:MAG: metallophosphoesterase [Vicinamibacterales bacterium]